MTRYLALFRPNPELEEQLESGLTIPRSGLHCTLWYVDIRPSSQDELIDNLAAIDFESFKTRTTHYELLDANVHALLLEKPEELASLHNDIVYAMNLPSINRGKFNKEFSRYGGTNYKPHITISRGVKPDNPERYVGLETVVNSFELLRRDDRCGWMPVHKFFAQETTDICYQ